MALYKIDTLDRLLRFISDMVDDNRQNVKNLSSLKEMAGFGDPNSKDILKGVIINYINKSVDTQNINLLIEQYHVNYFEKVYTGNNKDFGMIINSLCIHRDDNLNVKIGLLAQIIFQELYGLSVIDIYSYNDVDGLNEINLNTKDFVSFQIKGRKERVKKLYFKDEVSYEDTIRRSVSFSKLDNFHPLDFNNPEVKCERICGARVTAVMPPYSRYYSLNLRYTGATFFSKEFFIASRTSNLYMEEFIDLIMKGRPNIFVLGGQGTGKTTYLLRLISSIPENVSILTIESTLELNILKYFPDKDVKNLKFFKLKSPEDCFKTGLRMNRDIIIDGEVLTPEEAYITLEAMTRQNRGSMGSFHTSSNQDFIYDYKNMLLRGGIYKTEESALYDIARAVNILIFISINRQTGKRYIKEVSEMIFKPEDYHRPYELSTLFKYDRKKDELFPVNRISEAFLDRAMDYEFTESDRVKLYNLYKKIKI
ncbi:ATPase, T2SS/T4P/T4SS family [Clostridium sp. MT-14]|jgi:pilus assembly protein CpaF|nr:ATPase, T2SS/T4P/T4SS family [Clostridium sp. HV4-5-A1G]KAA8664632.1 type II secretion system protein E [Clostridium sp. HV4-5-A1G]